jgi:dihydroflavonol-4-reductase
VKAFVTGATGLLGNNLVRALRAQGHDVTALVRDRTKASRLLDGTGIDIVVGDMKDVAGFAPAMDGADAVFHTAAYFREAFGPGSHEEALEEINVRATLTLLDEADRRRVRAFVHVGSGGTVGRKPDGSAGDEDTPPLPVQRENPYFRSKIRGGAELAAWKGRGSMSVIEVLPGWIWGPWDAAPTEAGKLVAEFLRGGIPANIDGGTMIVDARDVAAAMVAAVRRALASPDPGTGAERFLIGGHYCTMREIMRLLEDATGVRGPRFTIPHAVLLAYAHGCVAWGNLAGTAPLVTPTAVRTMHAKIALDSSRAVRELGVTFREPADTFRDTVEWLRGGGGAPAA